MNAADDDQKFVVAAANNLLYACEAVIINNKALSARFDVFSESNPDRETLEECYTQMVELGKVMRATGLREQNKYSFSADEMIQKADEAYHFVVEVCKITRNMERVIDMSVAEETYHSQMLQNNRPSVARLRRTVMEATNPVPFFQQFREGRYDYSQELKPQYERVSDLFDQVKEHFILSLGEINARLENRVDNPQINFQDENYAAQVTAAYIKDLNLDRKNKISLESKQPREYATLAPMPDGIDFVECLPQTMPPPDNAVVVQESPPRPSPPRTPTSTINLFDDEWGSAAGEWDSPDRRASPRRPTKRARALLEASPARVSQGAGPAFPDRNSQGAGPASPDRRNASLDSLLSLTLQPSPSPSPSDELVALLSGKFPGTGKSGV